MKLKTHVVVGLVALVLAQGAGVAWGQKPADCHTRLWLALLSVEPFVEPAELPTMGTGITWDTIEGCDAECEIKRLERRLAQLKERRDRRQRLTEARERMTQTLRACAP